MRARRADAVSVSVLLLAFLLLVSSASLPSCASSNAPDIKTNPVGAVAYHADHVTQVMGKIEKLIMDAADATPPLIPVAKAKEALLTCRAVDVKSVELADALTELDKIGLDQIGQKKALDKVLTILDAISVGLANIQVPIGNETTRAAIAALLPEVTSIIRLVMLNLPRILP